MADCCNVVEIVEQPAAVVEVVESAATAVEVVQQADNRIEIVSASAATIEVIDSPAATVEVIEQTSEIVEIFLQQGPKGNDGLKGDKGDDGLSAYEVAVLEGFVGTEAQWLASLKGDTGPPGESAPTFTYVQSVAAATWTINHNLGFKPTVELFDSGSQVVDAHIAHTSNQQTIVQFTAPIAGFARLN